jgi:hypothetical protein
MKISFWWKDIKISRDIECQQTNKKTTGSQRKSDKKLLSRFWSLKPLLLLLVQLQPFSITPQLIHVFI